MISEAGREAIREGLRQAWADPDRAARMRANLRHPRQWTEEQRQQQRERLAGLSEQRRAQAKALWAKRDYKLRQRAIRAARGASEKQRQSASITARALLLTPEARAKCEASYLVAVAKRRARQMEAIAEVGITPTCRDPALIRTALNHPAIPARLLADFLGVAGSTLWKWRNGVMPRPVPGDLRRIERRALMALDPGGAWTWPREIPVYAWRHLRGTDLIECKRADGKTWRRITPAGRKALAR